MKWNTYQDMENRAYSSILTTLFPEHTKTLPRILVWSVLFLIDLSLGAATLYIARQELAVSSGWVEALIFLGVTGGAFGLETLIWDIWRRLCG